MLCYYDYCSIELKLIIGMICKKNSFIRKNGFPMVFVVSSSHQSPRCGVSRFQSAQSIAIPLSHMVSFDIADTLKQKFGVAFRASAASLQN